MHRHLQTVVRALQIRPRLLSAIAAGTCVAWLLPMALSTITRTLLSWDVAVLLYLLLAVVMFARATPTHMRERAISQDDGALTVLALTVAAASATIAAIILELSGIKSFAPQLRYLHIGLGLITLVCSWTFVHTSFALHYAHDYYIGLHKSKQHALIFPEQPDPDYWDFVYFSFVVGMTSQTSDVAVASRKMRRLVVLHGVIAFFFNAALLALAINAAASTL